jgi:hypothetical protein
MCGKAGTYKLLLKPRQRLLQLQPHGREHGFGFFEGFALQKCQL